LLYTCSTGLPNTTVMRSVPGGTLTMRMCVADAELVTTVTDDCETAGLPGSSPKAVYNQSIDCFYTPQRMVILVNYAKLFQFIGTCTTNTTTIRRVIRNSSLHEFMHHMGFPHDLYNNSDTGIMRTTLSCTAMRDFSMLPSEYHRFALDDIDMGNTHVDLDVYDEDLSCFGFVGQ
jgi:hypothetical protein